MQDLSCVARLKVCIQDWEFVCKAGGLYARLEVAMEDCRFRNEILDMLWKIGGLYSKL